MNYNTVSENQNRFFNEHPFPGLDLTHLISSQQFVYYVEKNSLYRAIKKIIKPGSKVLDAGCGTGEFTTYLAVDNSIEVFGIDYSLKTVEWANKVKARFWNEDNLSFFSKDIFGLSLSDYGKFDCILAMGLFPSIPNEQEGMRKLLSVLGSGGIVIFGFFDPIGRAYIRLLRKLIQSITNNFNSQEIICKSTLIKHLNNKNEEKWHINQLTEEYLNYHSPRMAVDMIEKCHISILDIYPKLKIFGDIFEGHLKINSLYSIPIHHLLCRIYWLLSNTDGYYVVIGMKPI